MLLTDVIPTEFAISKAVTDKNLLMIKQSCSTFLADSVGMPVYKDQRSDIDSIKRVKVRQRKSVDLVTEVFNSAFINIARGIRQRSIIVGSTPPTNLPPDRVPSYVFPVNNFNFLYSTTVKNSAEQCDQLYEILNTNLVESQTAVDLIVDLIRSTYSSNSLIEGIMAGSEIIIYNIPAYFSVRADIYKDYDALYNAIISST